MGPEEGDLLFWGFEWERPGSMNSPGLVSGPWGERGSRAAASAVVRVRRKGR